MATRRDPSTIRGSIVPLVTPFTKEGTFDEPTFTRLIAWQIESGSHGLIAYLSVYVLTLAV